MYFVGIDISKFKHDCAIIDELGDVITPSWSFQNDREGFSLLRELLDALEGEKKIGLESTGHYGQNLKLFLENNGFSFMEFNPLLVNRFVRSKSLRKTKTDSIDALMIAQYLMTVEYKPYPPSFYTLEKLKSLTRFLVIQLYWSVLEFTRMQRKLQQVKTPDFSGIATVFRRHCWTIGMQIKCSRFFCLERHRRELGENWPCLEFVLPAVDGRIIRRF